MTRTRNRHKDPLSDAQIEESVTHILDVQSKVRYLTTEIFVMSFLALTMAVPVPPSFKETGAFWAKLLWVTNLIWTLVAAIGWKELPPKKLEKLSKEQQYDYWRSATIWFRMHKGGFILLISASMLLIAIGLLNFLQGMEWVAGLAVASYLLTFMLSLWQRKNILRAVIEGCPFDTQSGRLMATLILIGPAAGAAIGSTIGIVLVRLHLLPQNFLVALLGPLGIVLADALVPFVIENFQEVWIRVRAKTPTEG